MKLFTERWLAASVAILPYFNSLAVAIRHSTSPTYSSNNTCPQLCSHTGSDMAMWDVYPDMSKLKPCSATMFYSLTLDDPVDNRVAGSHRISACTSSEAELEFVAPNEAFPQRPRADAPSSTVNLQLGWWQEGPDVVATAHRALLRDVRQYLAGGHGHSKDQPFTMFAKFGQATLAIYVGRALRAEQIGEIAINHLEDRLSSSSVSGPLLSMQLCEPGYSSDHVFGLMLASNGTFGSLQNAVKSWRSVACLRLPHTANITADIQFTMPLLSVPTNTSTNTTTPPPQATLTTNITTTLSNGTLSQSLNPIVSNPKLQSRADCRTIDVNAGDICDTLAARCGISRQDFDKYNIGDDKFCRGLKEGQHICCSSGSMPDYAPQPNADGSCFAHLIGDGDNCDKLSLKYTLSHDKLNEFNKKTWGWNTCERPLFKGTLMCLSKGRPPFPAAVTNAVCGPLKPGTQDPKDDSDISLLNPCPLNACCNIWGSCGISADFCVDTNTGSPGTAEPGTYGCVSNCGTDIVKGDGTGSIRVGYFEGYGLGRECLYQDASQIDRSAYTHLHFGFGTLSPTFEVETGDILSTYQFDQFKQLGGVKRILSFGGWDFSNSPSTYMIFRQAVLAENRVKVATNIANFIKQNDLDGVDIDWEYPAAPDLPGAGYPVGDPKEADWFLAFLVILKNLLPGKSVSIAAPSSYWYLKQYDIKKISAVIDYIVFMTYDLHGQWDAGGGHSQEGCDNGSCLRSQVNLTETKQSLAMITKAGVPGRKVVVGVTSYGRSYKMAQPGCMGPDCQYLGSRDNSPAKKGVCTGTGGYLADAEIDEIKSDRRRAGRVVASFVDSTSNSDILVYDNDEWVSYMSPATKKARTALYKAWGLGGTTDWATDLQKYNDPPAPAKDWATFRRDVKDGNSPVTDKERSGNWTKMQCDDALILDMKNVEIPDLWKWTDSEDAWADVKRIWTEIDRPKYLSGAKKSLTFLYSVHETIKSAAEYQDCADLDKTDHCSYDSCSPGMNSQYSGPAGMVVWNSIVVIRDAHKRLYDAIGNGASTFGMSMADMHNTFAPIEKSDENKWLTIFFDLLTMGTLTALGPAFNTFLGKLPGLTGTGAANLKDTTMALTGGSLGLAKDLTLLAPDKMFWTPTKQDKFSAYMGGVIDGWKFMINSSLKNIMNATTDEAVNLIEKTIAGGRLYPKYGVPEFSKSDMETDVKKSFYAFSIPALWAQSGSYPFIIDSGASCDKRDPITKWMSTETQGKTGYCHENRLYYLASPEGWASDCYDGGCVDRDFSAPTGIDSITKGNNYGGVTKDDIIKGAVRTYIKNDSKNGGTAGRDALNNPDVVSELLNVDITAPGFIKLPVCRPEIARAAWENVTPGAEGTPVKGNSPNWPCDPISGRSTCGEIDYVDDTNGDSPTIKDCEQIIRNIEGDPSTTWNQQVVGKKWRDIKAENCAFSFRASKADGNGDFTVGGQNVIDIINKAVKDFGKDGKVAANGHMTCAGNIKKEWTEWKIHKV